MTDSAKKAETFGARLAAARLAAGLTQEKLGERLGVSKTQISHYEHDTNRPGYDKIAEIERAVGRSMAYLLTGEEGLGGKVIDPRVYEVILQIDAMPPALREFVYGAIRLAEETKGHLPAQFLNAPTPENWAQYATYLTQLAELLRNNKPLK